MRFTPVNMRSSPHSGGIYRLFTGFSGYFQLFLVYFFCSNGNRRAPFPVCCPIVDCSGLVTWAAVNAAGTADAVEAIGNGVRDQYGKCEAAAWSEAQPGDLAFFPDLSHVGIVLGWGPSGGLRVLHCSKTLGGVVVSEDGGGIGFSLVGRPAFYALYAGEHEE